MAESKFFTLPEAPELMAYSKVEGEDGELRFIGEVLVYGGSNILARAIRKLDKGLFKENFINVRYPNEMAGGLKETARVVNAEHDPNEEYAYLTLWLSFPQLRALAQSSGMELTDL